MKESKFKVTVTFTTPILGSQPDRQVASRFIAERSGFELPGDEIEMLPDALERGTTVFHRDADGSLALMDYQVRGFLKASAQVQNGQVSGGVKNLRSKVNNTVFVTPRVIQLELPSGAEIEYNERPLRAETAQGPRIALARSEQLPAGTTCSFTVTALGSTISEDVLRELLDYGEYQGLGQWRNGSWGQFSYELERVE